MPWFGFLVLQNERGAEFLSAKAKFSQAFQTWTEFGPSPLQQKTGGQTAALPVRRVLMGYCSRFWGGPQGSLQFLCNFFAFPLFLAVQRRFATGFAKISSLWHHVFPFALSGPAGPVLTLRWPRGGCAAEPLPAADSGEAEQGQPSKYASGPRPAPHIWATATRRERAPCLPSSCA